MEQLLAIIEAQEDRILTLISESTESLNTSAIAKRLEAIENVNNKLCKEFIDFKSTIGQKSYSNAVKSGQQRQIDSKISEKSNHLVIIKPNNSQNASSKSTENSLKNIVNKSKVKVAIKSVKYISEAGIVVNCDTEEDTNKMFDILAETKTEFSARKPRTQWPRIAIFNVNQEINEDNIIEEIIQNNKNIKDFFESKSGEGVDNYLKLKFKYRKGNRSMSQSTQSSNKELNTWVIETSPELFKVVSNMRSILMAWRSCPFSEHLNIKRCYKCCGYGHIVAQCKSETNICGICAGTQCTGICQNQSQLKCHNCHHYNQFKHCKRQLNTCNTVFSSDCQSFKRIKSIIQFKIQYE
jgi:hypothetical protein